jgi:hypothetical protein
MLGLFSCSPYTDEVDPLLLRCTLVAFGGPKRPILRCNRKPAFRGIATLGEAASIYVHALYHSETGSISRRSRAVHSLRR